MKLSIVSDVHITTREDESFHLFLQFLEKQKKIMPDSIILLGDIFDAVAGDQKRYLIKYHEIFEKIAELVRLGIKFIYFEGNHDMHLTKLFERVSKYYSFDSDCFEVVKKFRIIRDHKHSIYLSHGDELEGGKGYLKYKKFIHGGGMNWIADHIIPFHLLEFVANRASKKSRGINYVKYSSEKEQEKIRLSFRSIAQEVSQRYSVSHVFLGHSHLQDLYKKDDFLYGNCGYFTSLKEFILYDNGEVSFICMN